MPSVNVVLGDVGIHLRSFGTSFISYVIKTGKSRLSLEDITDVENISPMSERRV